MLVAALGAPLTVVALLFGPAEYFSLMVLGLVFAVVLAKGSVLKAHRHDPARACCCRWSAPTSRPAPSRMTFDIPELADGIGFVTVAMGVFGFAEIMRNLEQTAEPRHRPEPRSPA